MNTHASHDQPATATAWPKMDLSLLDERHGAPPPFPLDVLPPFWRAWTEAATASTGAPADYVAMSLLTAAGSLVPGRRVMPAPGWVEPCILWTALVGPPSCGKTPAVEAACGLLRGVWQQRHRGPRNPDGGKLPEPFTNGTSFDIILGMLREARRGVLLVRDEQEGWLAHMARGTRDGSAHAFWLSAWCQRGLDFGWRGKTVELDDPSLSILGTAHPDALEPALRRDDGGVLARFLFVRPALSADYRPLSGAAVSAPEAVAALWRLYQRPWEMRDLSLTGEALVVFEHFRRAHCLPMPDLAGKAAAWWGKGPSQVLRLAGVLTFLDWAAELGGTAEPQQVSAWAVEAAVRLWRDHLWPHAQATFRIAGAGGEHESRQRQVVRWLAQQGLPEVSREHIRRDALSQALDAAATERLIADLVEGGWLRPVAPAVGGRGRRRRRWHVHAGLWAASPSEAHLPDAHSPGACPHPGPVERASGASPAAATGDLDPPDAVSASPASMFDAGTVLAVEQVDLGLTPSISAIPASDFGMAMPVTVALAQFDAAPGVPAIPATGSVAAIDRPGTNDVTGEVEDSGDCGRFRKTAEDDARCRKPLESRGTRETPELRQLRHRLGVPPSSAPTPEAAPSPSDDLCATPASESAATLTASTPSGGQDAADTSASEPAGKAAALGPVVHRRVTAMIAAHVDPAADDDRSAPRMNRHARRRERRLALRRQGTDPVQQSVAA